MPRTDLSFCCGTPSFQKIGEESLIQINEQGVERAFPRESRFKEFESENRRRRLPARNRFSVPAG